MSVSLNEVIESAGFDIEHNVDDLLWFLGQKSDFEDMYEKAEALMDYLNDCYYDYGAAHPDEYMNFDDWLKTEAKINVEIK